MTEPHKNVIKTLFIFVLITFIASCSTDNAKGIKTSIKGSLPAFKGKSITISEFVVNSAIPIDTAEIRKKVLSGSGSAARDRDSSS